MNKIYLLDSSFIFIHDIYQLLQDFAQQNDKTRCSKIVRHNGTMLNISTGWISRSMYSLAYLEGKHYADVFFAVTTLTLLVRTSSCLTDI